jgi:arsenate reductase
MTKVVFACVHNAGRSQMARAFFEQLADPTRAVAVSAGTHPGERVHPEVVDAMAEIGLDLSAVVPQKLTAQLANGASLLVTMGCGDECPFIPGAIVDDWPLADPRGQDRVMVRRIRDEIRSRVERLVNMRGWARASN